MLLNVIQEAADTLLADPYFSNIAVVSEDLGDPQNEIDRYLTKVNGIGVQLITPRADILKPDKPGPYYDDIDFIASVWENVKLNRSATGTSKKALDVAETVSAVLHWHRPVNIAESIVAKRIVLFPDPTRRFLAYNVLFKTMGGIQYVIQTIATPTVQVVVNGNGTSTVTITCATANVAIYYTTAVAPQTPDYPSPLNAFGAFNSLYTAPFVLTTGTLLRLRAWLPGYRPSAVVQVQV